MRYQWFAILIGAILLCGCNGKPSTYLVTGTVTIDEVPVSDGDIVFLDAGNVLASDADKIKDGKFEFKVKAGQKKVEIMASRKEKLPSGKTGAMGETEMLVNYIPERYNTKTELTAEVTPGGSNKFEFKLSSQPKP